MSKQTIASRMGGVTISAPSTERVVVGQKLPPMGIPSMVAPFVERRETFREKVSLLKNKDGGDLISSDEISLLEKIYLTNNDPFFRLSDDTKSVIYEIISQIYAKGFTNVYNTLISKKWTKRSEYFFQNSPEMELSRQKASIDKEIFNSKIEASKGAFKCRRCGSEETISVEKQMRRADEPTTIKVTCLSCGNKWTE